MSTEMTHRQIEIVKLYAAGATGSDDPEARLPGPTPAALEAGVAAVMKIFPDANVFEIRMALQRSGERSAEQAGLMRRVLDEAKRRGLRPGQAVMSVFAPGEVDRLFPGLPQVMRRAPRIQNDKEAPCAD